MDTNTRRLSILVFATALFFGSTARAEGAMTTAVGDAPRWVPVRVIDFEDDTVEGDAQRPDGLDIYAVIKPMHSSLIEVRDGFLPELAKMLEDL
jgi:hypothetical protein